MGYCPLVVAQKILAFITTIVWFKMRICRADIVADVKLIDFIFFMNLFHLPSTNATYFHFIYNFISVIVYYLETKEYVDRNNMKIEISLASGRHRTCELRVSSPVS